MSVSGLMNDFKQKKSFKKKFVISKTVRCKGYSIWSEVWFYPPSPLIDFKNNVLLSLEPCKLLFLQVQLFKIWVYVYQWNRVTFVARFWPLLKFATFLFGLDWVISKNWLEIKTNTTCKGKKDTIIPYIPESPGKWDKLYTPLLLLSDVGVGGKNAMKKAAWQTSPPWQKKLKLEGGTKKGFKICL